MSADEQHPMPITVDELSDDERRWLVDLEGVHLEDSRVIIVRLADDAIGFDVATSRGPVSIRADMAVTTGRLREIRFPDGSVDLVPELNIEAFGLPWLITAGPGRLIGTRYDNAGRAIRAALRGFPWAATWGTLGDEETFPTDIPDQPTNVPGVFVEDPDELVTMPYEGRPTTEAKQSSWWVACLDPGCRLAHEADSDGVLRHPAPLRPLTAADVAVVEDAVTDRVRPEAADLHPMLISLVPETGELKIVLDSAKDPRAVPAVLSALTQAGYPNRACEAGNAVTVFVSSPHALAGDGCLRCGRQGIALIQQCAEPDPEGRQ